MKIIKFGIRIEMRWPKPIRNELKKSVCWIACRSWNIFELNYWYEVQVLCDYWKKITTNSKKNWFSAWIESSQIIQPNIISAPQHTPHAATKFTINTKLLCECKNIFTVYYPSYDISLELPQSFPRIHLRLCFLV